MIKETCSCGATFEMTDPRWSQPEWANKGLTVEQQEVKMWRETHKHEQWIEAPKEGFDWPPDPPEPFAKPGTVNRG